MNIIKLPLLLQVLVAAAAVVGFVSADDVNTTTTTTDGQQQQQQQQCIMESTALNKDPNVGSATQELLTTTKDDVLANFTDFCSVLQRKCTVDLAQYSTKLQQACQSTSVDVEVDDGSGTGSTTTTTTNGQFHDYQIVIECRTDTFVPDAIEIPGSVQLDNVPTCIGQSCDPTNLPPEITELLDQLLETLTNEIDAQLGNSIVCTQSINSSNSTDSSGAAAAVVGYGGGSWSSSSTSVVASFAIALMTAIIM